MKDDDLELLRKQLTPRQERFCIELRKDGVAAAAAVRAGYSEKGAAVQAHRLLKMPQVAAYVKKLFELDVSAAGLDKNGIVARAYDIYLKCMQLVPAKEFDEKSARWVYKGSYTFNATGAVKALAVIKDVLNLGDKAKLIVEHDKAQKLSVNIEVLDRVLDENSEEVNRSLDENSEGLNRSLDENP